MNRKKRVLFVCAANSCRSQMAEGFLRHLGRERFEAYSAGLEPTEINPLSIEVMAERGVDIKKQYSKSIDEINLNKIDVIVTLCGDAEARCPHVPPGTKRVHWALEDPAKFRGSSVETYEKFRQIRGEIEMMVKKLTEDLV